MFSVHFYIHTLQLGGSSGTSEYSVWLKVENVILVPLNGLLCEEKQTWARIDLSGILILSEHLVFKL